MKRHRFLILFLLLSLFLSACGKIPVTDTMDSSSFLTERIEVTDDAYQWKELPWYTAKKDAMKKMEDHNLFYNEGDMLSYTNEWTMTDGTPLKAKLTLGFLDESDEGKLALVRWIFFMEDDDQETVLRLFKDFCTQLETWTGNENNVQESVTQNTASLRQESGSYINITWNTNSSDHCAVHSEYPD